MKKIIFLSLASFCIAAALESCLFDYLQIGVDNEED